MTDWHPSRIDFCNAEHPASEAHCYKQPGHDGPHTGWSHYPGQVVSWTESPDSGRLVGHLNPSERNNA